MSAPLWRVKGAMISAFIDSGGQNIGGEIGAILGARVGGMSAERVEAAAGMLPNTAPPIPMETKTPE